MYAAEMSLVIVPRDEVMQDAGDYSAIISTLDRKTVTETFGPVARSDTTLERASRNLGIDLIAMQRSGAITIDASVIPATSVIRIEVKSSNPEQAAMIAHQIGAEAITVADEVRYPYVLQVLDTVSVPNEPVGTSLVTDGLLGLIVGALTGFGLAFAVDYVEHTRVRGRYGRVPS
jgi:capsular polysaccharide biosynthesis protein